jgi:hypothetical protein
MQRPRWRDQTNIKQTTTKQQIKLAGNQAIW